MSGCLELLKVVVAVFYLFGENLMRICYFRSKVRVIWGLFGMGGGEN